MLLKVDRLILRVPSLEAAVRYYRDTLGLKLLRHERHVAGFRLGDDATELVLHDDPDQPAEAVYYLVDDVRDLYRRREELQLKFTGQPKQAARGYSATVRDPFGSVLLLLDRTTQQSARDVVEDARSPGALFAGVETRVPTKKQVLIDLYVKIGRTADDLPYTPHFESLYKSYAAAHTSGAKPTRQETWRHLLNLRKGGKLPKLGDARSESPDVGEESEAALRKMLGEDIGKRDRLPYTPRFDQIVDAFNKTQPRPLSPHLVWRLVAKLAK